MNSFVVIMYMLLSLCIVLYSIFVLWIFFEILFFIYIHFIILPDINKPVKHVAPIFKKPNDIFKDAYRILSIIKDDYPHEMFFTLYFLKADFQEICVDNYDTLMAWALYTIQLPQLDKEQFETIKTLRNLATDIFQIQWKDGYNPAIKNMHVTFEPLHYIHHPLLLCSILWCIELYTNIKNLRFRGFSKERLSDGTTYWIFIHPTSNYLPVLLLHGIFTGWHFYNDLIQELCKTRSVILYNYDCIKLMSFDLRVPNAYEVNMNVREILNRHAIEKINLIGHSWGTFLCNWIVRLSPHIIHHLTLIEPITITVFFPEQTYTILYKPPETFADYLLYYFVRNDLNLSHALVHNFTWYNMYLDIDDIPVSIEITIVISTNDNMVNFSAINPLADYHIRKRQQLQATDETIRPIHKYINQDLLHGECIYDMNCIHAIVDFMQS